MCRNEYSFIVLIMHYTLNSDNSFFSFRLFAKNLKFWRTKVPHFSQWWNLEKRTTIILIRSFVGWIKARKEMFPVKEIDWGGEVVSIEKERKKERERNGMFV
jgi:hypothetical protein